LYLTRNFAITNSYMHLQQWPNAAQVVQEIAFKKIHNTK